MSGGNLLAVILFGSVARGDDDAASDIDVLAIVESRSGRVDDELVRCHLPISLRSAHPEISWYGSDRFKEMSADGQLFCWHICLDGRVLYDPVGYVRGLGEPAPYKNMLADIDAFMSIADGVEPQIQASHFNAVYELGVLYVCVRNVAMSGSWVLLDRPDFTRNSPFNVSPSLADFGVDLETYRVSMECRQASQRGGALPERVDKDVVVEYARNARRWMSAVRAKALGAA